MGTCPVCGFSNTVKRAAKALPVQKMLNRRYMIGRVLGIGGFGITYVAYDMALKKRMAVKEYFPAEWAVRDNDNLIPSSQNEEHRYIHGRKVFQNEARILGTLKDIPNIVNISDMFEENGTAYMVMDLLDGYTLTAYLKAIGKKYFPYTEANKIINAAGMSLYQVHQRMFLHRDISPDNIMLTKDGQIYLIDFGSTRMYALNSPNSMSVILKPGFAPVEQYSRSGHQGPWTDVYALAATYYYLVTGKKPPTTPERISGVRMVSLGEQVAGIPKNISDAIDHAMAEKYEERTANVYAFLYEMGLVNTGRDAAQKQWLEAKDEDLIHDRMCQRKCSNPCVVMQIGNQRQRMYFDRDLSLLIGRHVETGAGFIKIKNDKQVSGLHCRLWFDRSNSRFAVVNYSANRTYTSKGILDKDQTTYLYAGEWLYLQTDKERYIFYLEVE